MKVNSLSIVKLSCAFDFKSVKTSVLLEKCLRGSRLGEVFLFPFDD